MAAPGGTPQLKQEVKERRVRARGGHGRRAGEEPKGECGGQCRVGVRDPGSWHYSTNQQEWQVRLVGSGHMPAIPVHARQASAWLLTQFCQDHPSHTQSQHHPGKERGGQRTRWTLSLFSAGH